MDRSLIPGQLSNSHSSIAPKVFIFLLHHSKILIDPTAFLQAQGIIPMLQLGNQGSRKRSASDAGAGAEDEEDEEDSEEDQVLSVRITLLCVPQFYDLKLVNLGPNSGAN
jgi:hypothetical protein